MTFKASAIQMCSGVDIQKNANAMKRLIREAASKGGVYVEGLPASGSAAA